jgi:hypothetical protein
VSAYISDNPAINPPSHKTEQKEVMGALLNLLEVVMGALDRNPKKEELTFLASVLVNASTSYKQAVELTHDKF